MLVRSQELGGRSSVNRPRIGAYGMPSSEMLTANWSGFFDLSGCLARSKKATEPIDPPIEDEDEYDSLPRF
jgi:hypothetical protein